MILSHGDFLFVVIYPIISINILINKLAFNKDANSHKSIKEFTYNNNNQGIWLRLVI